MYFDLKKCGERIQQLRKQKGMTQEEFAEKLNISTSTLGRIERGLQGFSIDFLVELYCFFQGSMEYIILGEEFSASDNKNELTAIIDQLVKLRQKL